MIPWVQIIEQDRYDLTEIHRKIFDVIKEQQIDVKEKSIFLKVSFVFPVRNPERVKMIITNPHFIAAVAYALVEAGSKRVYIGDGETFGCAQYSFEIVGMKEALQEIPKNIRKKIKLCYLDEVQKDWITPDHPFLPGVSFDYPRIVRDVDLYISRPDPDHAGMVCLVGNPGGGHFFARSSRLPGVLRPHKTIRLGFLACPGKVVVAV
jgi:uncharacterized protein (DUF362 family)